MSIERFVEVDRILAMRANLRREIQAARSLQSETEVANLYKALRALDEPLRLALEKAGVK
jgi:hypothetical protein